MMKHKTLGYLGEDIAAEYLESNGFEILERNYTVRGGEIDIIARDSDTIAFVEVKTRASGDYSGREAVDERKCAFLVGAAEKYIWDKNDSTSELLARFDLVEICFDDISGKPKIMYYKNIIF